EGPCNTTDRVMPQPVGVRRFVIVFAAVSALAAAGLPFAGVHAAEDAYQPPRDGDDPYAPPRDGAYDQAPPDAQAPSPPYRPSGAYDQTPPDAQPPSPPYRPGGAYREDDQYRRYDGPDTAARRPDDGG